MTPPDKPLAWVGTSLADVHRFPGAVRRAAGYQLRRVQAGLMPDDWKPMPIQFLREAYAAHSASRHPAGQGAAG